MDGVRSEDLKDLQQVAVDSNNAAKVDLKQYNNLVREAAGEFLAKPPANTKKEDYTAVKNWVNSQDLSASTKSGNSFTPRRAAGMLYNGFKAVVGAAEEYYGDNSRLGQEIQKNKQEYQATKQVRDKIPEHILFANGRKDKVLKLESRIEKNLEVAEAANGLVLNGYSTINMKNSPQNLGDTVISQWKKFKANGPDAADRCLTAAQTEAIRNVDYKEVAKQQIAFEKSTGIQPDVEVVPSGKSPQEAYGAKVLQAAEQAIKGQPKAGLTKRLAGDSVIGNMLSLVPSPDPGRKKNIGIPAA